MYIKYVYIMWLLVIWMYATYVKWCIIQYAFKVDTHTHTHNLGHATIE